jgi:hypothetical protein
MASKGDQISFYLSIDPYKKRIDGWKFLVARLEKYIKSPPCLFLYYNSPMTFTDVLSTLRRE